MPGTEIGYGATGVRALLAAILTCGTEIEYGATGCMVPRSGMMHGMMLRIHGTETGYGVVYDATDVVCDATGAWY
eukprot:2105956-Rhodomonas_salina.1